MNLAVYRLKTDGKISRVHKTRDVDDLDDLRQAIKRYNANQDHKDTVEITKVADNSLEMFLYNRAELNIKDHKDEIENMSNVLYKLGESLDWLCEQVKAAEQ